MPFERYGRAVDRVPGGLADRTWPEHVIRHAPLWASVDLRDGNQALANPMDAARKRRMFDLLVKLGFKEIEVGYPAASEAEFSFVRDLIRQDRVPDDVTIVVFTPARPELIERTFEALRGVRRAVVHLCLATACLWREVVFQMSAGELKGFTLDAARQVARLADAMPGAAMRYEFSPETFNVTEPEFALEVSNAVLATWDAAPDRPVTLNLPTTVETDTPNIFADQVEWMSRSLDRRASVILSVHPHNDRGTAVASAELALMAGADRVEGTLFGNGERTGNVCLATLALNLFSHGVEPQLDFSDIDSVRRTVEECNQMPVHARHPYAGDLVYTAFSGTHQDAIGKGLAALDEQARGGDTNPRRLPWQVPYLPIDPKDVGRTYESVVRVNSQSGKGGIAQVLKTHYGLDLPRPMRIEFAHAVQAITDHTGTELTSRHLWEAFTETYLEPRPWLLLKESAAEQTSSRSTTLQLFLVGPDGEETHLTGTGDDPVTATVKALQAGGHEVTLHGQTTHQTPDNRTAVYAHLTYAGETVYSAGLHPDPATAAASAVLTGINRVHGKGTNSR
ncbi:2-isopropylmalate synthase [Streptantibioticus ferralitis]|uniref:2-isopropylmalate synthase n=1 Tax=Streptantibioticus ferralitis TaxID=236510 RepID=A0ABT5YV84_9ACTN|nr:2-isopropylmalate synthase [Streptantibioticus ferralitis]MDF2255518.1 2-isopropylmalate synthase [Streptantibioticus ferralitis]